MEVAWNWWGAVGVLAMLVTWTLAALVYSASPRRRVNRLLALVLVTEGLAVGGATGLIFFMLRPEDAYAAQFLEVLAAAIGMPLYLAFLGASLDSPFARVFRSRAASVALAVSGAALVLLIFLRTDLFITGVYRPSFAPWNAELGPAWVRMGQTFAFLSLFALVACVDAHRRSAPGTATRRRAAAFTAAFGFRDAWYFVMFIGFPVLRPIPFWGDLIFNVGMALAALAFACILAYGVLRLQVLDIDLKIKWTLRQGTVAAVFLAVFFVVSESAAAFFEDATGGRYVGIVAAGVLVLALAPLQKLADRVADAAMPNVARSNEYLVFRRFEVYRAAVEGAFADGVISADERALLDRMRVSLGLAAGDAVAVERDVMGAATAPEELSTGAA